jgi:hypothetical protein
MQGNWVPKRRQDAAPTGLGCFCAILIASVAKIATFSKAHQECQIDLFIKTLKNIGFFVDLWEAISSAWLLLFQLAPGASPIQNQKMGTDLSRRIKT